MRRTDVAQQQNALGERALTDARKQLSVGGGFQIQRGHARDLWDGTAVVEGPYLRTSIFGSSFALLRFLEYLLVFNYCVMIGTLHAINLGVWCRQTRKKNHAPSSCVPVPTCNPRRPATDGLGSTGADRPTPRLFHQSARRLHVPDEPAGHARPRRPASPGPPLPHLRACRGAVYPKQPHPQKDHDSAILSNLLHLPHRTRVYGQLSPSGRSARLCHARDRQAHPEAGLW